MSTAELVAPRIRTSARPASVARRVVRRPLALAGLLWLVLVAVASFASSAIAPYAASQTDLRHVLEGPTGQHLLGTDQLGRDVLSRLMFGGRDALLGAGEATLVFVVAGVALGVLAGYYGGWVDWLVTRWAEITVALPAILILLVVLAVFAHNQIAAMVAFGLLAAPGLVRIMRAETLRVKNEPYIAAARVAGLTDGQILRRHVLSRLVTTIIVQAALLASVALVVQAGLAFLGLGAQDPQPSWGGMVNEAAAVIDRQSWLLVPSGGVIALSVMAFGLIGDALRDATAEQWERAGGSVRRRPEAPAPDEAPADAEPAPPGAVLSVRGLSVSFDTPSGPTAVVQDVSFDVGPGETLGIVGESGCGKSVTAGAILGVLPDNATVTARSCSFEGAELLSMRSSEREALRGRGIAYVSQEPMTALDPTARVGALLAEAVQRHRGVSRAEARVLAVELLETVSLPDPADVARRYPHQISGGMAQRVAIALALAGQPRLVIADEPTTALDVTVQRGILALLSRLQDEIGLSIILITHDWGVVAQVCARALVMYAGEVVEVGATAELYEDPAHPYTAGLLAANPQRAMDVAGPRPTRLPSIPGTVPPPQEWPHSCHFQDRCKLATAECRADAISLLPVGDGRRSRCVHVDALRTTEVRS
jgi:peptide/nickel transport system permease protein